MPSPHTTRSPDTPTTGGSAPKKRRFSAYERVVLVDLMVHQLKALDCRLTRLLGNMNADFGLTRARLRILDWVARHPGRNISWIAYDLGLTRQTVHRTVRAMEKARLLDLDEGSDGRAIYPRLTDAGLVVTKIRVTQAHAWTHELIDPVHTDTICSMRWFLDTMLRYLPQHLDPNAVDPENLPRGMHRHDHFLMMRYRERHHDLFDEAPVHPIMENGGDKLWPDRARKRGPLAKRSTHSA